MSALAEILSSRIRAELFRLLFSGGDTELHVREIERRTGFNDRAIRQEFEKLTRLGLVESRRDGNRRYYRANRAHPLYPEIRGMTLKTVGVVEVLRDHLKSEAVELAFVFGSVASGEAEAGSDIDLMVIGDLGMRTLTGMLHGASEQLGREINPHIYSRSEFGKRAEAGDHFASAVLASPRIWVKGSEDELAGLGS